MRPYRDPLVTLFLGDSRVIDKWLDADVLVTDPPYGRGWKQGELDKRPNGHGGIVGDDNTVARDAILAAWGDRPAIVFGDLMLAPPAGTRQVLIYRKPPNAGTRGATGGYRRDVEAVYLIGRWPTGLGGRSSVLTTATRSQGNPSSPQGKYDHPHAKPVDLMIELLTHTTGVVADPFCGSGSTLVAAKALGRKSIGVEIDLAWFQMSAQRCSQEVLDLSFFAPSADQTAVSDDNGEAA